MSISRIQAKEVKTTPDPASRSGVHTSESTLVPTANVTRPPAWTATFGERPLVSLSPTPVALTKTRGTTLKGEISFEGIPSPRLMGHELVHVAQQQLGNAGQPPASREALEAEAERLAPQLAAGNSVRVASPAAPGVPLNGTDPDVTYTSTVGIMTNDAYIAAAYDFHQKWGYKPRNVGSIEEITTDLAGGTGVLSRIRIVSHASQAKLYLQFAQGGPMGVLAPELTAKNQTETVEAGVEATDMYVTDASIEFFRGQVVDTDAALAGRLKIAKDKIIGDDRMRKFFLWLVNKHRVENIPGLSAADRALVLPGVNKPTADAKAAAVTNKSASEADLTALEGLVVKIAFKWTPMGPDEQLQTVLNRVKASSSAFTARNLAANQAKMRARFSPESTIEIRGCALGQNKNYMQAVQTYFGSGGKGPAVNAPDWYQYFGHVSLTQIDNTDDEIKKYWTTWVGKSELHSSFTKWAPIFAPSLALPASPDWTHLRDYLRAGHALPLKNGGAIFALKDMTEDQVIDWLSKQDQRLSTAAGISAQFKKGQVTGLVTTGTIVQWLQSEYADKPKQKIFSFDPGWSTHFITLLGRK